MSEVPTCVLVSNRAFGIAQSRSNLIKHFIDAGWRVIVAGAADGSVPRITAAGARFVDVRFARMGIAPKQDLDAFRRLRQCYSLARPTLIHHFNAKPLILGSIASAVVPDARVVNTLTGLGNTFSGGALRRRIARTGLRYAGSRAAATIFQNPADAAELVEEGIVSRECVRVIVSSGVKTRDFTPGVPGQRPLVVSMVARLLWNKGVRSFVELARSIRSVEQCVRFVIGGELDPGHPDGVPEEWLKSHVAAGDIEFVGYVSDMPSFLRKSDIFVFPSEYREGVPRVVMEAAASGLPVVTWDLPGTREPVLDGETGYLIPPGDMGALVAGVKTLLADAKLRRRMGERGRELMIEAFDEDRILARTIDVYRDLGLCI